MEFYAHKREMPDGAIVTQTVREHLVGTAQRAAQCLRQVGLEHAGYLAGLLHDLGKYTEAFQQYLDEGDSTKRGSVIHTFQGCRYLMEQYHRGDIQTISCAELLAFAVGAHHGLFDCVDQMRRIGLQYRAEKQDISYEEAVAAFRQEIPTVSQQSSLSGILCDMPNIGKTFTARYYVQSHKNAVYPLLKSDTSLPLSVVVWFPDATEA